MHTVTLDPRVTTVSFFRASVRVSVCLNVAYCNKIGISKACLGKKHQRASGLNSATQTNLHAKRNGSKSRQLQGVLVVALEATRPVERVGIIVVQALQNSDNDEAREDRIPNVVRRPHADERPERQRREANGLATVAHDNEDVTGDARSGLNQQTWRNGKRGPEVGQRHDHALDDVGAPLLPLQLPHRRKVLRPDCKGARVREACAQYNQCAITGQAKQYVRAPRAVYSSIAALLQG